MERAKGFEPSAPNSQPADSQRVSNHAQAAYAQIRAQEKSLPPELQRIVAAWDELSGPLKAAILAIVESAKGWVK